MMIMIMIMMIMIMVIIINMMVSRQVKQALEPVHLTKFEAVNNNLQQVEPSLS